MNTKKILAMVIALAMIVAIVPTFGLVASAAEVGTVVTYRDVKYTVTGDNKIANPDFAAGLEGWTRASDGAQLEWEVVDNADYSASENGKAVHFTGGATGGAGANTMRTLFDVEAGKTYYVSFNIHNSTGAATSNSKDSGMIAVAAAEKEGTGFGDPKESGLPMYGVNEHGGVSSWVSEFGLKAGSNPGRNDGAWQPGDNKVEHVITVPETAVTPVIVISLGAWGNSGLYYSNFSIQEAAEVAGDASVVVKYDNGDVIETVEGLYAGDTYTATAATGSYYIADNTLYIIGEAPEAITLVAGENVVVIPLEAYRKVVGENIVSNPGFEDDFSGWTNADGEELSGDEFEIVEDEAKVTEGSKALWTKGVAGAAGTAVDTSWTVEPGKTYFVSVDAMATKGSSQYAWFYAADEAGNKVYTSDYTNNDNGHFRLTANKFVTKAYVITTTADQTKLGFGGAWFGNDGAPIWDNFKLYKLDLLEGQEEVTVNVNYVDADGNVLESAGTVTGVTGEEVTVGEVGKFIQTKSGKYIVDAAVTIALTADDIAVPATELTVFTAGNTASQGTKGPVWSRGFEPKNWGDTGIANRIAFAVLDAPEAGDVYTLSATKKFAHANGGKPVVTTYHVISFDEFVALDTTKDEDIATALTEANKIVVTSYDPGTEDRTVVAVEYELNADAMKAVKGDKVVVVAYSNLGLIEMSDLALNSGTAAAAPEVSLGWSGTAFTIDVAADADAVVAYVEGNDVADAPNYRAAIAEDAEGVAFATSNTNAQYVFKSVKGGIRSASAVASVYGLVMDAIAAAAAEAEEGDVIEEAQLTAANAVLQAGGIFTADGKVTAEAAKVLDIDGDTVTIKAEVAALGFGFTAGVKAEGTYDTATVNENGTVTLSNSAAETEEVVVYLEEVEFVLEAAEAVADEAVSGELDFVEEV